MSSRALKRRGGTKKKNKPVVLMSLLAVAIASVFAVGLGTVAVAESWVSDLTDYDVAGVEDFNTARPTMVYASDGETLLAKFMLENRDPIELDQVSQYVLDATVATEDERFYEHGGFDIHGIARALFVTLTGGSREGASTITQQFVRNTILADEMTDISVKRKVREIFLSVELEKVFSKDDILHMYLNTINYGNSTYGIQAASQRYFSKNAADLTLAEAAALVGIPQSPTYNNPIDNPENCLERRNIVLDRMLANGYIGQEEHDAAQAEELILNENEPSNDGIFAYPYFTSYVRTVLTERYSTEEVFKGGWTVVTTLDVSMQDIAESCIDNKLGSMSGSLSGSLVAVDPDNGYVRALVGGQDYYGNQVNLATGEGTSYTNPGRPCGSAFKMFTLLAAIEAGIDPQTTVDCGSPAVIPNTPYSQGSSLQNIDNINYGTRTIARAFAVSSNTGFVRLQMSVGTEKVKEMAQRLGITSPLETVASLTLGQQNVTMLDMATAYACVANGGTYYEPEPILLITDHNGEVLQDNSAPEGKQVLDPEVAYAAREVMKLVVNSGEGTGTAARLSSGQEVAAKTGTSSDYLDITFCGITPQYSVAIWFGDISNQTRIAAHVSAADVFSSFLNQVLGGEVEYFPTASSPKYQLGYVDSVYHLGGAYSTEKSKEKDDDKKDDAANSNANNNQGGNNGTGGGTEGGGTGGGTEGGGTGGGGEGGGTGGGGEGGTGGGEGGTP